MKGFTLCCHPELTLLPLSVTPEGRSPESSHRISGSNKTGFTLIELLVVILIIGILAAVALPQYEKAVMRSRFTQMVTAARSIVQAQQAFSMANGGYADNLSDLDVTFPNNNGNEVSLADGLCRSNVGGVGCYLLKKGIVYKPRTVAALVLRQ